MNGNDGSAFEIAMDHNDRRGQSRRRFEEHVEGISSLAGVLLEFQTDRSFIIREDFEFFWHFFDIHRINRAGCLDLLFDRISFSIGGFDHDKRELFEVPEVRKYVRRLAAEWPYFFYASSLQDGWLWTLVRCLLDNYTVVSKDTENKFQIVYDPGEVNDVCLPLMNGLKEICGMNRKFNQARLDARIAEIKNYFKTSGR